MQTPASPSTTWDIGTGRLHLLRGDLTSQHADAIVNAANSGLLGGGGVDGAIHRAAGSQLVESCRDIVRASGPLPPGQAVITPGFNLAARHIIHTVGPIYRDGTHGEVDTLASAYAESLRLAHENGLRSIAFPAISCGVYGFPTTQAAPIALRELARGLKQDLASEAFMVLHSAEDHAVWLDAARQLFDIPQA